MSNFVTNYTDRMLRNLVSYFQEYYNQDALVFWFKTTAGMVVLNVPQYLPEVQGIAKLISVVGGSISAILGLSLLILKTHDEVSKRFNKKKR